MTSPFPAAQINAEGEVVDAWDKLSAELKHLSARRRLNEQKADEIRERLRTLTPRGEEQLAELVSEAAENFYTTATGSGFLAGLVRRRGTLPDSTLIAFHTLASSADGLTFAERTTQALKRAGADPSVSSISAAAAAEEIEAEASKHEAIAEDAANKLDELEPRQRALRNARNALDRGANAEKLIAELKKKGHFA